MKPTPTPTPTNAYLESTPSATTRCDNHYATYYENAVLRTPDTLSIDHVTLGDFLALKKTDHELRQDLTAAAFASQDLNFYTWVQQHVERRWLYQQVHNRVIAALSSVDTTKEHLATERNYLTKDFLGLVLVVHFTAREALSNPPVAYSRVNQNTVLNPYLDVYRLTEHERRCHQSGAIVYSFDPNSYATYIQDLIHLQQALRWRYGNRPYTSITVEQARTVAEQWVASLARLRQLTAGTVNTDPVPYYPTALESEYNGSGRWYFSRLLDQDSYTAEGAAMNHCVGGYKIQSTTRIYSLRHHIEKDGEPALDKEHNVPLYTRIATLETSIDGGGNQRLVQVRMKNNAQPTANVSGVVARWCEFNSIIDATKTINLFGHPVGDLVVRQTLLAMHEQSSRADLVYLNPNNILNSTYNNLIISNAGQDGDVSLANRIDAIERLQQKVDSLKLTPPKPRSYLTRLSEITRRTFLGY